MLFRDVQLRREEVWVGVVGHNELWYLLTQVQRSVGKFILGMAHNEGLLQSPANILFRNWENETSESHQSHATQQAVETIT